MIFRLRDIADVKSENFIIMLHEKVYSPCIWIGILLE